MQQTSRNRLKQVPAKLAAFIELANLAPADFSFKNLNAVIEKAFDAKPKTTRRSKRHRRVNQAATDRQVVAVEKAVKSFVRRLPNPMRDHLLEVMSQPVHWAATLRPEHAGLGAVVEVLKRYNEIYNSREKLRTICKRVAEEKADPDKFAFNDASIFPSDARSFFDKGFIIRIAKDDFTEAIEDVDAQRIRECEICNHLFWAGRIDAFCCSTLCHNAQRNRRYRAKRQQGYYQGAKLTKKERADLVKRTTGKVNQSKKGTSIT